MNKNVTLTKDEQVYLDLQALYESYGYRKFRMRKFEEYSLYEEYKAFLTSEFVLTFHNPEGKLMALRPDVTLSIVKNTQADERHTEKVFYRENVYRMEKHTKEYREIDQAGLEMIGTIDQTALLEVVTMAKKSLALIDPDCILCLSHMGIVEGILDACPDLTPAKREEIIGCIRSQSAHDLSRLLISVGADEGWTAGLCALLSMQGDFSSILAETKKLTVNAAMERAVCELEALYTGLCALKADSGVRLDFTILSDLDYYNGIVMQGYVENYPKAILTGGQYDRLIAKFNKNMGAVGFALAIGELNSCYPNRPEYDFDVFLQYDEQDDPVKVLSKAETLRNDGKRVQIGREMPDGLICREKINLKGEVL